MYFSILYPSDCCIKNINVIKVWKIFTVVTINEPII